MEICYQILHLFFRISQSVLPSSLNGKETVSWCSQLHLNGTRLARSQIMTLAILTVALVNDHLMTEFVIHLRTLKTSFRWVPHPSNPNL